MAYDIDIQMVRKIYRKYFKFERNGDFQPYLKYLAMLFLVVFMIILTVFTKLVVHTLIIIIAPDGRSLSLSLAPLNSSFTHRNAILSLFMQVIWRQAFYGDLMKFIQYLAAVFTYGLALFMILLSFALIDFISVEYSIGGIYLFFSRCNKGCCMHLAFLFS